MSDASPAQQDTAPTARSTPNFAARRMLVTTVAITAVIAFAIIGWRVVRGDDDGLLGTAGSWDELVIIDRASGEIIVLNDDGEPDRTIVGLGRVTDVYAIDDRLALVGGAQIALHGGDDEPTTIAIDRNSTVTAIRTDGGLDLVIGSATGGNVRIVDVVSRDVHDVGAMAEQTDPLLFAETIRWAADGSAFAIADAASFQTIMIRDGADEARYFPSQPIALDDDRVATSQIVGSQADVGLFEDDRNSTARVPSEIPAGGVMVDGSLLMVSTKGVVSRVGDGDVEATELGQIAVPSGGTVTAVHPTWNGQRLVVTGDVFEAVIDLEGTTLFTTTFTSAVTTARPDPTWTCLPIGGAGTFHSLVLLETGEQLADLSGVEVTGTSSDGCTVIGERNGITEVIGTEGSTSLGQMRSATIGPDGRTVVRTTTGGDTQIVSLGDDLALDETIDISASVPSNAIIAFLD